MLVNLYKSTISGVGVQEDFILLMKIGMHLLWIGVMLDALEGSEVKAVAIGEFYQWP